MSLTILTPPNLRPRSKGGSMWLAGIDFPMADGWDAYQDQGGSCGAYVFAGRVYWQGQVQRVSGDSLTPWERTWRHGRRFSRPSPPSR